MSRMDMASLAEVVAGVDDEAVKNVTSRVNYGSVSQTFRRLLLDFHETKHANGMKLCAPCSKMLLSGLVSVGGGGGGGSSEQLPGDRNSRTTLSTCGLKMWFILGSTTWATILSTPCSSIPDLRGTV